MEKNQLSLVVCYCEGKIKKRNNKLLQKKVFIQKSYTKVYVIIPQNEKRNK